MSIGCQQVSLYSTTTGKKKKPLKRRCNSNVESLDNGDTGSFFRNWGRKIRSGRVKTASFLSAAASPSYPDLVLLTRLSGELAPGAINQQMESPTHMESRSGDYDRDTVTQRAPPRSWYDS